MKRVLIAAFILAIGAGPAAAACKYQNEDGSWTYSQSCARLSEKEIDQSANRVLKRNHELQNPSTGLEGRRLRGYEYSDTTHSGMRIRMVEPTKAPPAKQQPTVQ